MKRCGKCGQDYAVEFDSCPACAAGTKRDSFVGWTVAMFLVVLIGPTFGLPTPMRWGAAAFAVVFALASLFTR